MTRSVHSPGPGASALGLLQSPAGNVLVWCRGSVGARMSKPKIAHACHGSVWLTDLVAWKRPPSKLYCTTARRRSLSEGTRLGDAAGEPLNLIMLYLWKMAAALFGSRLSLEVSP